MIRSLIELFAFAFLITSTIVLWAAFLFAILHGDAATIYINLSGERNAEIILCILGTTAAMLTTQLLT